MYRCLTEFPGRTPGCVVPLSTLTFELEGGRLWPEIAAWEVVVDALVRLGRERACDALCLGLSDYALTLLSVGPNTNLTFHDVSTGRPRLAEKHERRVEIDKLVGYVRDYVTQGPFHPGENLVRPPRLPYEMPYRPLEPLTGSGDVATKRKRRFGPR